MSARIRVGLSSVTSGRARDPAPIKAGAEGEFKVQPRNRAPRLAPGRAVRMVLRAPEPDQQPAANAVIPTEGVAQNHDRDAVPRVEPEKTGIAGDDVLLMKLAQADNSSTKVPQRSDAATIRRSART